MQIYGKLSQLRDFNFQLIFVLHRKNFFLFKYSRPYDTTKVAECKIDITRVFHLVFLFVFYLEFHLRLLELKK